MLVSNTILYKSNQDPLEKWLISRDQKGLERKYKRWPWSILLITQSKKVLKKTTMMEVCQRVNRANWKSCQKLKQWDQQNKVVPDYNPKYKTNIQQSILIKINYSVNKWGENRQSPV